MNIIQIDPNCEYICSSYSSCSGFTSLMYLVCNTRENPEYLEQIKYILDNYLEELNKQNALNFTPIMLAVMNYNTNSTLETVNLLLEYKPDLNIIGYGDCTVIERFILNEQDYSMIKLLLDHGADINRTDLSKKNILMYLSSRHDAYEKIKFFLENSDIDIYYKKYIHDKTIYEYILEREDNKLINLMDTYNNLDIKCALD